MKRLLILLLFPVMCSAQDVAWRTIVDSVVYVSTDTFLVRVAPLDLNDNGAFPLEYGALLVDNTGHRYAVVDRTGNELTVVDVFKTGQAPYGNRVGLVCDVLGDTYIPLINYEWLDAQAFDYGYKLDLEQLWRDSDSTKMDLLFDYLALDSLLFNQVDQVSGQIYNVGDRFFMYTGDTTGTLDDYVEIGTTITGDVDAANLYYTNDTSTTDNSYFQLSYDFDPTEDEKSIVVTSGTSPLYYATHISDLEITGNSIPAGNWFFTFYAKVSSLSGTTTLGTEVFLRHANGTETTLFTVESEDLETNDYERFTVGTTQPTYSVSTTDKLGVRTYASTTQNPNTTINTYVGGSNGAYINTPLQLRHDLLRDKNGNDEFLHVTLDEKNQISINRDSIQELAGLTLDDVVKNGAETDESLEIGNQLTITGRYPWISFSETEAINNWSIIVDANSLSFRENGNADIRARLFEGGNLRIGRVGTDTGHKFYAEGDGYFSGTVQHDSNLGNGTGYSATVDDLEAYAQPILTAGDNINISASNVISAAVGSYMGQWDASTNTPTLADGVGDIGANYQVSVAGVAFSDTFNIGDGIYYNGTNWIKKELLSDVSFASISGDPYDNTDLGMALDAKANLDTLSDVAFSNSYDDLDDTPVLSVYAEAAEVSDSLSAHLSLIRENEVNISTNAGDIATNTQAIIDTAQSIADEQAVQDANIAANITDITTIEAEQITQNASIQANSEMTWNDVMNNGASTNNSATINNNLTVTGESNLDGIILNTDLNNALSRGIQIPTYGGNKYAGIGRGGAGTGVYWNSQNARHLYLVSGEDGKIYFSSIVGDPFSDASVTRSDFGAIDADGLTVNGEMYHASHLTSTTDYSATLSDARQIVSDSLTASSHNPVTVTNSSTVEFTLNDQDISADVIQGNLVLADMDSTGFRIDASQVEGGIDLDTFASVAFTGSYNDLDSVPTIPTDNSELTNGAGYLTTYTETDPFYTASSWYTTTNNATNWDEAYSWGNHANAGYLTSYTETDPFYTASSWYTTTNNATNWDEAYSWGNHANAGYTQNDVAETITERWEFPNVSIGSDFGTDSYALNVNGASNFEYTALFNSVAVFDRYTQFTETTEPSALSGAARMWYDTDGKLYFKTDAGTYDLTASSGGSTDYISNVELNGTSLDFTGVGSAYTGSVDLSGLGGTGSVGSLDAVTNVGSITTNTIGVGGIEIGTSPGYSYPSSQARNLIINDNGNSGGARVAAVGTSGLLSPGLEMIIDGSTAKRALVLLNEEGSNDYGLRFYTTNNGSVATTMSLTGDGELFAPYLNNTTTSYVTYYNPSTGEITYGTAPSGTGSLDAVTNVGSITTNTIGVGGIEIGTSPGYSYPSSQARNLIINDNGNSGGARVAAVGTSGLLSPGLEMIIDGSTAKRALVLLNEEGSNDYGLRFYTTNNGSVATTMSLTGDGELFAPYLNNTTTSYVTYYNPSTGEITYGTAPSGGGSTDYVSNMTLSGTDLVVTGTGSAFSGTIDLSSLGGTGTNTTNLSYTRTSTTVTVASDTGTDAILPQATESYAGVMNATDKAAVNALGSMSTMGFWTGTQAEYDALGTYDNSTLYFIEDE